MNRTFFIFALLAGASLASANTISITGSITLDHDQPTYHDGVYDWEYTIGTTCTGNNCHSNIGDIDTIEIFDVGGVTSVHAPDNWTASDTSLGGGLYDVTFTSDYGMYDRPPTSLNGFYIDSIYGEATTANYTVTLNGQQTDPVVGAPAMLTPEPASLGLTGFALLGLGAFKRRKNKKR